MDVKELMKGDKIGVRSNDGYDLHIFTVSEIKENGISCGKDFVYYDFDEIEAIPFAYEIFEKNEFERQTFNGTIITPKNPLSILIGMMSM